MYVIYALIDPDEIYKVCYIGISDNVYNRFTQHLRDIEKSSLKAQWLKEIRDRNRVPYCKVLEEVPTQEDARKREAYWIHFYKQLNMPLTNSTIPQVPQDAHTDEQVKEIAVKATRLSKENEQLVRNALIQYPNAGVREIARYAGIPPASAWRCLKRIRETAS